MGLETMGQDTLETCITAAIELKLDDNTRLKWMEYSSSSETMPSYEELMKFLDIQARHHESIVHSVYDQHRRSLQGLHLQHDLRTLV